MKPLKTLDQWITHTTTVPPGSGVFEGISGIAKQLDIIQLLKGLANLHSFQNDWPPTLESLGATSLTYTLEPTRRTTTHANSEGRVEKSESPRPQPRSYRLVYVNGSPLMAEFMASVNHFRTIFHNLAASQGITLPSLLVSPSQQPRNTETMSRVGLSPEREQDSHDPGPSRANRSNLPYAFSGFEPGAIHARAQAARDLQISPGMVENFREEHPQGLQGLRFSQVLSLITRQSNPQRSPDRQVGPPHVTAPRVIGPHGNLDQGFQTAVQGRPPVQPPPDDTANPGLPSIDPGRTRGLGNGPLTAAPGYGDPPNTAPVLNPPNMAEQLDRQPARIRLRDQDTLDHIQQRQQPPNRRNRNGNPESQPHPPPRRHSRPNVAPVPNPPNRVVQQAQVRPAGTLGHVPQRRIAPAQENRNGNTQARPPPPRAAPRPQLAPGRQNLNRAPPPPPAPRPQLAPNLRNPERAGRPRVLPQPDHATRLQDPAREPPARAGPAPPPPVNCLICTEPIKRPFNIHSVQLPCGHVHCHDCLANGLRVSIRTMPFSPVRCCQRIDISILRRTGVAKAEEVQIYRKKLTELNEGQPLYCYDPKCSDFIPTALRSKNVGKCRKCQKKTCTECRHAFHLGACDSEDSTAAPGDAPGRPEGGQQISSRAMRIQRATELMRKRREEDRRRARREMMMRHEEAQFRRYSAIRGWKPCPNCRTMIEKIDGCNHIFCTHCGTHFCYRCGKAPYGNHGPCAM